MSYSATHSVTQPASSSLVGWTQVIYALHAVSILTGILGAATVIGAFLIGWPSIIAVILNYIKRGEARGTWLESHFSWQIRTFWYALLWAIVSVLIMMTIIGLPIGAALFFALGIWAIYRIARGWLRLKDRQAMPV
jgi:uncharacterized membrane protein